jgi:N6-L-threonylcarbamoyladenine synthase
MKILAIETSCDETALSVLETKELKTGIHVKVLGNAINSQIKIHEKYGGVFPTLAKRAHAENIIPLLNIVLKDSGLLKDLKNKRKLGQKEKNKIEKLFSHEPEIIPDIISIYEKYKTPEIDKIAVTEGPGLEPALWVGINTAKALGLLWNIEIIPENHMKGHLLSSLIEKKSNGKSLKLLTPEKPIVALLISGGHTEIVVSKKSGKYEVLGETLDDAVGEAFDKVARMLSLPYPGGPQISLLAKNAREKFKEEKLKELSSLLPRPMKGSKDFNFSFSGLKTAVLYTIKKIETVDENTKMEIAYAFEEAVADVLSHKLLKACEKVEAKTIVVGGGVSANEYLRKRIRNMVEEKMTNVKLYLPEKELSTDNAVMIGLSAIVSMGENKKFKKSFSANGTLKINK